LADAGVEGNKSDRRSLEHNQILFVKDERNFFPKMFGWFLIRSVSDKFEATTLDEIEWVLSKAAGYNSGFGLTIHAAVMRTNGNLDALLEAVRQWESARNAMAFTEEQKAKLRDVKQDFHMEPIGEGLWNLFAVDISDPLACDPSELQPGQPGGSDWAFVNHRPDQPLRFCMRVMPGSGGVSGAVRRPTLNVNGSYMTFDTDLAVSQYLVCEGGRIGKVYDQNWNLLRTVQASAEPPIVKKGKQTVSFSCKFEGRSKPVVEMRLFTRSSPETVGGPQ
jgi:hypothetical protein